MNNDDLDPSDLLPVSDKEAKNLEKLLKKNSVDIRSRFRLVKYYYMKELSFIEKIKHMICSENWKPESVKLHEMHVLWLIANCPEHRYCSERYLEIIPERNFDGYSKAKTLWHRASNSMPDDFNVLLNAAHFFAFIDPKLAREYLENAENIKTDYSFWERAQLSRIWRIVKD